MKSPQSPRKSKSKQVRSLVWQLSAGLLIMLMTSYALIVYQNIKAERDLLTHQFEQIERNLKHQQSIGTPLSAELIEPMIFIDNPYQIIVYTSDQPIVLKRSNYLDGSEARFGLPIWSGQANSLEFSDGFLIGWRELSGMRQLYVQIAQGKSGHWGMARFEPVLSTMFLPLLVALILLLQTWRLLNQYQREWKQIFDQVQLIDTQSEYRPLRNSRFQEFIQLEHTVNRISHHTQALRTQLELMRRTKTLLIDEQPLPVCVLDTESEVRESNSSFNRHFNSTASGTTLSLGEMLELEADDKPLTEQLAEYKPLNLIIKNRLNQQSYLLISAPVSSAGKDRLHVAALCPINELITQNRLLNQSVQKMSQQSGRDQQRMASLSHELRTPLTGMIATLDLLERTELSAEQLEYVRLFSSSSNTLLGMLNDLLDFSKINAGKLKLEIHEVDLLELAQSSCELMVGVAERSQVDLFLEVAPGVPARVMADAPRIKQVLLNLMGNAVKFTRQGEVRLLLEPLEPDHPELTQRHMRANNEVTWVRLSVIDSGLGIEPDDLERLFLAYEQLSGDAQISKSGTGLGLVISQQLTRLMGGFITAESTANIGSKFRMYLPLSPASKHQIYQFRQLPVLKITLLTGNPWLRDWLHRSLGYLQIGLQSYDDPSELTNQISTLLIDENQIKPELATQLKNTPLAPNTIVIRLGRNPSLGAQAFSKISQRFASGAVSKPLFVDQLIAEILRVSAQKTEATGVLFVGPLDQNELLTPKLGSAANTANRPQPESKSESSKPEPAPESTPEQHAADQVNLKSEPEQNTPLANKPAPLAKQSGIQVLLAEDNTTNQVITTAMLKKIGVNTLLAANGEEVLELMQEHEPTLILMDCRMPKLDGISATVELRKLGYQLPIIALTANDTEGDRLKCFEAGMQDFLAKPLRMKQLADVIDKHASAKHSKQ